MRLPLLGGYLLYLLACIASAPAADAPSYEVVAIGGMNGPGARPSGGLVLGPDGNYYGTAPEGGAFAGGTVFKLTPAGVLTTLVALPFREGRPNEGLTVGSDGSLYGTSNGTLSAPAARATVFRVTLAGQLTTVANLTNNTGTTVSPQRC